MEWNIYLSGEIHTNRRDEIIKSFKLLKLPIEFTSPVTNHELSDKCGVIIMGDEKEKFWHDHKGAKLNMIRNRASIEHADIVIVRFGDEYKQWNAAFEAGYAIGLSKPLIVIHSEKNQHALKEIDAVALAVTKNVDEVINALRYIIEGKIKN